MDWLVNSVESDFFRGLVLFLALLTALASVWSAHYTARKKQSIDMILSTRQDSMLSESLALIARLHDAKDDNIRRYSNSDMRGNETTVKIQYALNHYEYVAVGIRRGIYSEEIIKDSAFNTVVKLYERALPFIENVRTVNGTHTYFQELECLAKCWKGKPLKQKKK